MATKDNEGGGPLGGEFEISVMNLYFYANAINV